MIRAAESLKASNSPFCSCKPPFLLSPSRFHVTIKVCTRRLASVYECVRCNLAQKAAKCPSWRLHVHVPSAPWSVSALAIYRQSRRNTIGYSSGKPVIYVLRANAIALLFRYAAEDPLHACHSDHADVVLLSKLLRGLRYLRRSRRLPEKLSYALKPEQVSF